MSDKYTFLTQAPVHRVIGAMAIPTIISMLLTSMYNLVDTFFVGKINTQSTAAVGIVFSVMFFIQAFSFFFGNGSGNYISRQLGAQNTKDAEVMASTGLFYTLVFSLIVMLLGWIFLEPISILLGSHPLKTIFQHKACTDKLYADSFYKVQKNSHSSFEVICCRR